MTRYVLPLFAGLVLASCGSATVTYRPSRVIVAEESGAPVLRMAADYTTGDEIGTVPHLDTLATVARVSSRTGAIRYMILYRGDTALVRYSEVMPFWYFHPTTFTIPAEQDADAWARANSYVAKHATLKIQVSTAFQVETYNATKPGEISFSINRLPQGNKVQYTVTSNGSQLVPNARKAAYYIQTGAEPEL